MDISFHLAGCFSIPFIQCMLFFNISIYRAAKTACYHDLTRFEHIMKWISTCVSV